MDVAAWIERPRAPYAADPKMSRGRLVPEPSSPTRTDFQRDRDRVLHSTAFRRLKHKTQVFVYHEGDHYRTRLTHTLEVAQIARSIARALGLDEDLAETVALAHDIGHPPFGHSGERALDELMRPYGGFDHNAQTLRVLTRLERRYAAFDGLNLTWETLEGLIKHNGPLVDGAGRPTGRYECGAVPAAIAEGADRLGVPLAGHASAEAQAAAIADDIAYDAHDVDDGLRAGLFRLNDLKDAPLLADILREVERKHPGLDEHRGGHEVVRRVITRLVEDAIAEGGRRIDALSPADADAIRASGSPMIDFSPEMAEAERGVKRLLNARMYRAKRVDRIMADAAGIVRDLFGRYFSDPSSLPGEWAREAGRGSETSHARAVADFIAGMTDRYALTEHRRLFDDTPDLR
ncbi:deoxyguanosinetriphosphate triphosphohydrolase [Chelatococcus sambhunathii]|uniref:Deoxyguanosinetriphosphate triphosphohydrolase-like protein n=1 Tax=Chelatococcus sambhunathii TaxID=363953 RepID=A0ABU1DJY0_9HYPH|nr:deoxyguanosinetriphosphate triphosphohydrolase [Chelatococcus sambhunathii]MDR4308433.1 deoxyguanosinetriphosphate triphosphohydrolase [Chelatococcus sambhunathii]